MISQAQRVARTWAARSIGLLDGARVPTEDVEEGVS